METEFHFAAVGDVHGKQRLLVERVSAWEAATGQAIDFVLGVGDFEPHRDEADLATKTGPAKFRELGDFPDFVAGRARFPWPLYFIAGNHEPFGYLETIPRGGEVAPNCTYLGRAGCRTIAGLRVAYLSGIHSPKAFGDERPSAAQLRRGQSWKAATYFNRKDVEAVLAWGRADVLVVHDWPAGAVSAANVAAHDRAHRTPARLVGNPWARTLVDELRPRLVLAGHMHYGHRDQLRLPSGEPCDFVAVGHISRDDSVAVFRWRPQLLEIL